MPDFRTTESFKAFLAICIAALLWSSGGVLIKLISWEPAAITWGRAFFGGIFLILFTRSRTLRFSPLQAAGGIAYAFTSLSFIVATKLTLAMRAQKDASPLDSIIIGSGIIVLCLFPFLLRAITVRNICSLDTVLVFSLGIFHAALPFLFFAYAVRRISAFEATLFKAVEPMVNPVWVFLFTGEKPGITAVSGAVLILATVFGHNIILVRTPGGMADKSNRR